MAAFPTAQEVLAQKYPRVFAALGNRVAGKDPRMYHCACGYSEHSQRVVYKHINRWTRAGEQNHRMLTFQEQQSR